MVEYATYYTFNNTNHKTLPNLYYILICAFHFI